MNYEHEWEQHTLAQLRAYEDAIKRETNLREETGEVKSENSAES